MFIRLRKRQPGRINPPKPNKISIWRRRVDLGKALTGMPGVPVRIYYRVSKVFEQFKYIEKRGVVPHPTVQGFMKCGTTINTIFNIQQ